MLKQFGLAMVLLIAFTTRAVAATAIYNLGTLGGSPVSATAIRLPAPLLSGLTVLVALCAAALSRVPMRR